jgi:hypothetical protein
MRKTLFGLILGLLAGGTGVWLYLHHAGGAPEGKPKEETTAEPIVQRGTNGETFLKLDEAAQKHADLKMTVLEAAELKPESKAFGRVLDPGPLAASLMEMATAEAALEASGKEAERLRLLFSQGQNASARAFEAAEAAVKRDRIAAEAVHLRLLTAWGKSVAEQPRLDVFIHSLIRQEASLVRVDVPASDKMEGTPTAARLALLSAPDRPLDAEFVGPAVSADPQTLGRGFFFLVKGEALAANVTVSAWLTLPGKPEPGVILPREAIVRHEGEAFVYVQTSHETFARKATELHHPLPAGWFTDEFKAGTKIVTNGAQQLLSEELKGEGGEE